MPPHDDASNDDGSVLSPEELDITDDENVEEIDDGRYVISPGEGDDPPEEADEAEEEADGEFAFPDDAEPTAEEPELTATEVHEWMAGHVGDRDAKFGFDVTATFEGTTDQRELFSDDVVTPFEHLAVWYAQHVGGDTPVDEVLGILLVEANVPIRYPGSTVRELVSTHDLDPEDSIAELLSAVEDGVRFPP